MTPKYFVLFFLSISALVKGQTTINIKLTITGDSTFSINRKSQFKINMENISDKCIFIYPGYINFKIYNSKDTVIRECIVDKNKKSKIFLNINRSNSRFKLKSHSIYMSSIRLIDFNELCWKGNIENINEIFIKAEYYDVKLNRLFYSDPKVLLKE
jgi:hypothetical protein